MRMMKILALLLLGSLGTQAQWVNGFYTGNNGIETIPNIPWPKYTALIHFAAYAGVNGSNVGNGTVNMSNIPDTAALIAARPLGKKVLLCLKDNDSFANAFAQSAASGTRATFVTNITSAVVSNGYDGVDMDWEANVNTSDYIALIAALRAAMPTKIITMDAGDFNGLPTVANGAQANLDEVNVECYDMDSPNNNTDCGGVNCTWFNDSILQAGDTFKNTCAQRTGVITTAGVAIPKIGIGIPYYGRRFTGVQTPQTIGTFPFSTVLYRNLVTDPVRFQPANQQYDTVHIGQYLSIASLNEFNTYTGTRQIGDIISWWRGQGYGGVFTFTLEYEYLGTQSGDARYPLSTALYTALYGSTTPFPVDSKGWIITGLPAASNNLLGPLIPSGNSPWIYSDLAEKQTADNMAPAALAEAPTLGTQLAGTVSWNQGDSFATTTANLTSALAGQSWVAFAWNSIDGVGTGRALCPVSSVTSTHINCQEELQEPTSSGVTAYLLPPPDSHGWDFQSWTTENPSVTWNYYDVSIALYRLYYRTGSVVYQSYAQQYADIMWQWTLDHGYRRVAPRASSMLSQFFRAAEGHTERWPGLYNWIVTLQNPIWVNPAASPNIDNREVGYQLWNNAIGAKMDTDPTRHTAYCSALSTNTATWNSVQAADGSFPENEFALNTFYVSAPNSFTPPFLYQGAPWREAINVRSLEAAYESLNDTTSQGCNDTGLAASTLTSITKAVTWQNNYGRDTVNRGIFYEVSSQSDDQDSVPSNGSPAAGTINTTLSSTAVTGSGTGWVTAGYCDGTHFIGFIDSTTIYKIASCSDNTHMTLTVAFGLYGEMSGISGGTYRIAPSSFTGCSSSAIYCFGQNGDRNLTRTTCGGFAWLYSMTLNLTYKGWSDECVSASLGGPTAGLTTAANLGGVTLPCSGVGCDGLVTDTVASAASCYTQPVPCVYGSFLYGNLGKNYGEAFGAPGIDNALAWRLVPTGGTTMGGRMTFGGNSVH